jgi:hypothetical protein
MYTTLNLNLITTIREEPKYNTVFLPIFTYYYNSLTTLSIKHQTLVVNLISKLYALHLLATY